MMENHFTESGEAIFSVLNLLIHFRDFTESTDNHFSLKKLFRRAIAGLSIESAPGALPKRPQHARLEQLQHSGYLCCGTLF